MYIDPTNHIRPLARRYDLQHPKPRGIVLLLHGFADSPYSLRGLAQLLYADGYSVIVPRLPGHGARLGDFRKTGVRDWSELLKKEIDDAASMRRPLVVLGRSFGGILALCAAFQNKNIDALILLATPARIRWHKLKMGVLMLFGCVAKNIRKPWRKPEERIERLEVGRYEAMPIPALKEFFRAVQMVTPDLLRTIQIPTLVLHGTQDVVAQPKSAAWIFDRLGSHKKKLCMVEGVGHTSKDLNTHPRVVQEVRTFLGEHAPSRVETIG